MAALTAAGSYWLYCRKVANEVGCACGAIQIKKKNKKSLRYLSVSAKTKTILSL